MPSSVTYAAKHKIAMNRLSTTAESNYPIKSFRECAKVYEDVVGLNLARELSIDALKPVNCHVARVGNFKNET